MKYRSEIDGLRALAVLPVVAFHGNLPGFEGGFVGVDVFFVISGYLITSILLADMAKGTYSLLNFYERRARRILPALFFMLLCCIPAAWIFLVPESLENFGLAILTSIFFSSNFLFYADANYFAGVSELNPLLHTWSLAVEEQFYILFPLLLTVLRGRSTRTLLTTFVGIGLLSLGAAWWMAGTDKAMVFFMLPFRSFELLFGSILAVLHREGRLKKNNDLLGGIGLLLIVGSMFILDKKVPFPGPAAIPCCLGTAMVLAFSHQGSWVARLLSLRPLVLCGLMSYSLYLVHQPFLAFARHAGVFEPTPFYMGSLGLGIAVMTYISWAFVEAPFRDRKRFQPARILQLSGAGAVALSAFAAVLVAGAGFPQRFEIPGVVYPFGKEEQLRDSWEPMGTVVGVEHYQVQRNAIDRELWSHDPSTPTLLLVGNSHSIDCYNQLRAGWPQVDILRFGTQVRKARADGLLQMPNFEAADAVVVCTLWNSADLQAIDGLVEAIQAAGKIVAIVSPARRVPVQGEWTQVDQLLLKHHAGFDTTTEHGRRGLASKINRLLRSDRHSIAFRDLDGRHDSQVRRLRKISLKLGTLYIDRDAAFCESEQCFGIGDQLERFYVDGSHLTVHGSSVIGGRLAQQKMLAPLLAEIYVLGAR